MGLTTLPDPCAVALLAIPTMGAALGSGYLGTMGYTVILHCHLLSRQGFRL
jgi:hypothetical protein